jgi:hypothetical protein
LLQALLAGIPPSGSAGAHRQIEPNLNLSYDK